ncbi:SemiSWEET family sugar transporter [Flavihumibacter petaseus]|nr:SemiSWEET transporter [Flavihumibacter petaseus]
MANLPLYVGIGSGICTGISLLPQLIKLIREKKADDLSCGMLVLLLAGLGGWIWYGVLKSDWPIIITNAFSAIVNMLIIAFSLQYKKR